MTRVMQPFKRDDVVVHDRELALVLSCGPVSYDLIIQSGGTSRYRHDVGRDVRLATAADFSYSEKYEREVRDRLARQAVKAREERRSGAGVRRGQVW